ncbi:reprolysin-like metallopeptidase [Aeromonas sp. NJAU223]|uniref:reprolysin-like metallopeptidase n=1 Tax=Aeromonas sp. NJAU223 TaxID=3115650 RepID=UPI003DA936D2
MQSMKFSPLALLVAGLMASTGLAAKEWQTLVARATDADGYEVRANHYRIATVPADHFDALKGGARELTLPLPDGNEAVFTLQPYDLLPADLAAKYPDILTFKGQNKLSPTDTGRFDLGPQGFHAMFSHEGRMVFVDPLRNGEGYAVYYQQDAHSRLEEEADKVIGGEAKKLARQVLVDGNVRKRYVIAVSAAGEYTQYHGGTVEAGLAAIATMLNRVNEVYQRDVAAEFQLASGNDTIIYTDVATDPFLNDDNDIDINVNVQKSAQSLAGNKLGPFDIGHVVNTGGGGLAQLASLCGGDERSAGMTGSADPVGDAFFIDYVAHEIGHQFGAEHTFNGTTGSCGSGNRSPGQAWEPGSGSSIMAYAGICGEENLQVNSLPYFHSKSIEQMRAHMASVPSCGTAQSLTNNAPQVSAGSDYAIPANTPFVVKGGGSDLDGDPLSYTWEQIDLGNASFSAASMIDDGSRPLFPFVAPISLPERTLPSLPSLLTNTLAKGEAWPTTNRVLNFRLTARDGKGGVASDDMQIQVVNTGKAFRLTSPLVTPLAAGHNQTIGWEVAGTNAAPINCSKVDIAMTRDEGASWTLLASGLANSGSASVAIPAGNDGTARLKVACSNNLFFAISPFKLSVTQRVEEGGGGGGGALGLWPLALALLGWSRRRR